MLTSLPAVALGQRNIPRAWTGQRGAGCGHWALRFITTGLTLVLGHGCTALEPRPVATDISDAGVHEATDASNASRGCVRPEEGCACDGPASLPCFLPSELIDGQEMCQEGTRRCEGGAWTACLGVLSYVATKRPTTLALLDVDRNAGDGGIDVPNCDVCNAVCFKAVDELDPSDGPLDSNNSSGGVIYADPLGITLEAGEFGLPPGTSPPVVVGNNEPIVATLLPGESVTTVIDALPVSLNKLDVYFLIELDSTMSEELATLAQELSSATDFVGGSMCVDLDGDGAPDSFGAGLLEAVRCVAKDAWFGAGFFREVPFSPHAATGQVAYQHIQDMAADGSLAQAALAGLAVEDLSAFSDTPSSQTVALEALATRDGFEVAVDGSGLAAQVSCPVGTRGYPCFRDDAVALVVVLTDRSFHNGPASSNYTATFEVQAEPYATDDLSIQASLGTVVDPLDLGDVSSGWTQFVGATDADTSSTVPATVVTCDAAGASGDAVHVLSISGLPAAGTLPLTLSTYGSSFDTVVSLHDQPPSWLTAIDVLIADNTAADSETDGFPLPDGDRVIAALDVTLTGANTTGLGSEVTSNLMGCLGNDDSAPDAVYTFEVSAVGADLTIDTEGSSFDTVITLFQETVEPVTSTWEGWVDYDDFFTEGWDDWNRNGDGKLCNGGACDQDWVCDSGSPNKLCGFYLTGVEPVLDDVDCDGGSTCVFVIDAPGEDVRIDNVNVMSGSTFFLKVIAAGTVELDGFRCSNNSRCGIDFGDSPSVSTNDINCDNNSFCYVVHNEGELGDVDATGSAVLQIECGANSNCGKSTSHCENDSLCAVKRAPGSTVDVGLDCQNNAGCICLEGDSGDTGCENFCGASRAAVCANADGQDALTDGGPAVLGGVRRIACDDDGAADGLRSELETGPLEPGTYFLVVKGKRAGEEGAYNLRIRDARDDARLTCNDNALAGVSYSKVASYDVGNGTYYAVVKGRTAGDEGDYVLTVGVEPAPFQYTPPTYAESIVALNAEDIRVASLISCDPAGSDCATARSDADTLATDTRASVDSGSGVQPLSYIGAADASDLGSQTIQGIKDLADYFAMDVTWKVVDKSQNTSFDINPFTTTISPDNTSLCQGVSGSTYYTCQSGELPSFSVTFENPPSPGEVSDNPDTADGSYGFALQMVGTSPGVVGSPEYVLEEVPVFLVPNGNLDPVVPVDGSYSQTLNSRACPQDIRPDWQELFLKAYVPLGTSLDFKVCGAETEAELVACSLIDLVSLEAVGDCGSGCTGGSICASGLANVTPNDVCIQFTSAVACADDSGCPVGLTCQNDICIHPGGSIDIATVLPVDSVGSLWTRYDIEWRADTDRKLAPTLDYWHVTYTCDILN